jgi:HD domain
MADRNGHLNFKRYLPHAILATLVVILLPVVLVALLVLIMDPNPPLFITTFVAVIFGMLTVAAGSALWLRTPDSAEVSFGDLMIWGWLRRKRAEDLLAEGTRLLGLDRSGRPQMQQRVSREQQLTILRELTGALESKDPYTHGHSRRVERHVYRTAMAMGLPSQDIEDLRKAAALHDVGKIRVPDRILRKPEALTSDERAVLEDHVVVGAWMVSSAGNADVVSGVRHHHEEWDGSGYPDGLAHANIPLFSRIIAVADTFDAVTSTRPYRAGESRDRAIEILRAEAGRQFDPNVVDAFIKTLPAPVPVTASMLAFLTGPRALTSKAAVLLKRAGAGALAPAAGATGAVILAGAASFTPVPMGHHPLAAAGQHASRAVAEASGPGLTGQATGSQAQRQSGGSPRQRHRAAHAGALEETAPSSRGPAGALISSQPAGTPTAGGLPGSGGTPPTPGATPIPQPTANGPAPDSVALSPVSAVATVGGSHTITATVNGGGQPSQNVAVLFTVVGSGAPPGSCTTDASGVCGFTYAGPDLPGADAITACADSNATGGADIGEPCGEATVAWVAPVTTAGQTTGSGVIANDAGIPKIAFGFSVKNKDGSSKGECEVVDTTSSTNTTIECLDVTSLVQTDTHATFIGTATINGAATTYRIDVDDNADPGAGADTFRIHTSSGYLASGVLVSGDIQIHRLHSTPGVPGTDGQGSSPEPSPSPNITP